MHQLTHDLIAGRTVPVKNGLTDALRKLDQILLKNYVRGDRKKAKRHEKKGPKRRRIQAKRWGNIFANEASTATPH